MIVGRFRLVIRRLRYGMNVLVFKLGISFRCIVFDRLYENIIKYVFFSRLWVSLYNIGFAKSVLMILKVVSLWVTVRFVGSGLGGGIVTGEILKRL